MGLRKRWEINQSSSQSYNTIVDYPLNFWNYIEWYEYEDSM